MFQNREIVTAIEFGSSKICVLVGESCENGTVKIIGRGEARADGMIKGEIANMDTVFEQLGNALNDADAASGGELNNTRIFVVPISGCGISSYAGVGTVFIKNENKRVSSHDREEAHQNALIHPLDPDRLVLNSAESYFVIDDQLHRRDPMGQTAYKLDAHVHIIHGLINRIENFRTVIRDSGYENNIDLVFSPLASGQGVLAEEERENGVMLIDFGAGVTDYHVEFNSGVLASGQIQVGFSHVLNDLAIGLELPLETCRKLIEDGTLSAALAERRQYLNIPQPLNRVRRIPLDAFETIYQLRLRELFSIIREQAEAQTSLAKLNSGVVLTGGGALFEPVQKILRDEMQMSVRVGSPINMVGAVTGLENPRYSCVWGALKIADFYLRCDTAGSGGALNKLISGVDGVMTRMKEALGDFRGSFRF